MIPPKNFNKILFVDSSAVFGRERDREEMVRLVLSDNGHNSCNLCVIPVVGMGGLGKKNSYADFWVP